MEMNPLQLFKCLADPTRLSCVLLIYKEGELCVCELTEAIAMSQPKVSRHLAQLRECGLLQDRREGQWIYYQVNPSLPRWAKQVIAITLKENEGFIQLASLKLCDMRDRPQRII